MQRTEIPTANIDEITKIWHSYTMKMLIDMLAGAIALLAAAALSQLGIDLNRSPAPAEIQRLPNCSAEQAGTNTSGTQNC